LRDRQLHLERTTLACPSTTTISPQKEEVVEVSGGDGLLHAGPQPCTHAPYTQQALHQIMYGQHRFNLFSTCINKSLDMREILIMPLVTSLTMKNVTAIGKAAVLLTSMQDEAFVWQR
jgi:hypothetical protein